jgi:hypothetical protein
LNIDTLADLHVVKHPIAHLPARQTFDVKFQMSVEIGHTGEGIGAAKLIVAAHIEKLPGMIIERRCRLESNAANIQR